MSQGRRVGWWAMPCGTQRALSGGCGHFTCAAGVAGCISPRHACPVGGFIPVALTSTRRACRTEKPQTVPPSCRGPCVEGDGAAGVVSQLSLQEEPLTHNELTHITPAITQMDSTIQGCLPILNTEPTATQQCLRRELTQCLRRGQSLSTGKDKCLTPSLGCLYPRRGRLGALRPMRVSVTSISPLLSLHQTGSKFTNCTVPVSSGWTV